MLIKIKIHLIYTRRCYIQSIITHHNLERRHFLETEEIYLSALHDINFPVSYNNECLENLARYNIDNGFL